MFEKANVTVHATLSEAHVAAGFPSPAESYSDNPLDLNELLISKPQATFFVRVQGDSMQGAGIYNQDLLIVDRSLSPTNGSIIVAVLNSEFTLKRFIKNQHGLFLQPENPKFNTLKITDDMEFHIWGVATYVIHNIKAGQ